MDLSASRAREPEQRRVADLLDLVPPDVASALDVGARDGYISTRLADRVGRVTALDLELPAIAHQGVTCLQGDAVCLDLPDGYCDLVLCAEVLEHIPPADLPRACRELGRVAGRYLVIGVPYRQDLRVGRTTCRACGGKNPPWGHVNRFDEQRLRDLFPGFAIRRTSLVGRADPATNWLACLLMDLAGNPYGTYDQEERCIHCQARLTPPPPRSLGQKILTRLAVMTNRAQGMLAKERPNWLHALLVRT